MSPGASVAGEDGRLRCPWGARRPTTSRYHDDEWGRPVHDDDRALRAALPRGFQSGLSWLTILRKRENFRAAFAGFDIARGRRVRRRRRRAAAGRRRHRPQPRQDRRRDRQRPRRASSSTSGAGRRCSGRFAPGGDRAGAAWRWATSPATTPESTALAKELKRRGFRFVGPTTAYALDAGHRAGQRPPRRLLGSRPVRR